MDRDDSISMADRQLVVRESDVRATIAKLEHELADLQSRAVAVRREIDANTALLGYFPGQAQPVATSHPSIREMALAVLTDAGRPMGVREIIDATEARYGARVVRTSLSPILKKMEDRGLVEHVGSTWISKGKGPSVGADGPESDDMSLDVSSQTARLDEGDVDMNQT